MIGAIEQLLNEAAARLRIPLGPLPRVPVGDLLEPRGASQRAGADAIEQLLGRTAGSSASDPQAARASRPLLAQLEITGSGPDATTHLVVQAAAPGASWGRVGRESAMVAIYVDGTYHSTTVVFAERTGAIELNLGTLAPGPHHVELRAATDIAPVHPAVTSVRARVVSGEQALIDRLAPVIELRDVDPSRLHSTARSDAPMVLLPAITHHPDGGRTIEYQVLFSNEDAGTPPPALYAKYGRGIDAEPVYRVRLDAAGRVVEERYQATLHMWRSFDGAREGGRPVIRISTANNMVSTRTHGAAAERWSDAAVAPVADGCSDYDAMLANPWMWRVMSQELLREGKAAAAGAVRGSQQVGDPRRYVYLGPLGDAARAAIAAAGGLRLVLADGREVVAKVAKGFATGKFGQTALELPEGALADAVRGVAMLGVRALVLGADFAIRELAAAAA